MSCACRVPASSVRRSRRFVATTTLFTVVAALVAVTGVVAAPPSGQHAPAVWRDAVGKPLPFRGAGELMEFLRTADIVANDKIPIGITGPRRLTLELDGVRVNAAFRSVDETHSRVRLADGSFYQKLRDYCGYEVAAYRISGMLDMTNVPPAVPRRVQREDGTVQIWVENAMMEKDRIEQGLRSPRPQRWVQQIQEMLAFDQVIGNIDRNPGNILIDGQWTVWLIDHTRAFQQGGKLEKVGRIRMVRRRFWDRLQALDPDAVAAAMQGILESRQIDDMFRRRDELVTYLQGLIDQRGEGAVIYERGRGPQ